MELAKVHTEVRMAGAKLPPIALPTNCPGCGVALDPEALRKHLYVCECGHHFRLGADAWIILMADRATWKERWGDVRSHDLLNWKVPKPYQATIDQLADEGLNEAVRTGTCTLGGRPIWLAAFDFRFVGGTLSIVAGERLARGMEQILSAPDPVLRAYPEGLRVGLLALALRPETPPALADRAAGALLATLPREGHTYPRLALRRAAQLLERHADDRARVVLDDLHRARPDVRAVAPWRAALDARRLGRVALAGELPARGRLAPAFWLDGQRPVWLRTAAAPEAERLVAEARFQGALALPAIAPVVEHGVASAIPYVAVSGPGRPLLLDAAPPFELARAASGRRSPDQIRAYDWDGDPEPFIALFYPYGLRTEALVE